MLLGKISLPGRGSLALMILAALCLATFGTVVAKRQSPTPILSAWRGGDGGPEAVFGVSASGNTAGAITLAPAQLAVAGSIPGGENDRPHGRPIDPTRSDWLITQNWQQHRVNEGTNVGALDFAFVNNVNAFGSPLHATENGIVGTLADRGDGTGYGNAVYILGYIDPTTGISYNTVYGHFQKVYARSGQAINAGDVLGQMGSTGWSSGPHVHYEVWRCQRPADVVKQGIAYGTVNPSHTECANIDPADFIN